MRGRTDIEMRLRNPNYQRLAKQEKKSRTPPHFTAKNSKSDMIITLLKAGAEFEAQDYCGQTPLRLSLTNGQDRHGRHPFRKPRGDHYFTRAPVRRMKKARRLKPWMSSLSVPLLGICLGRQSICHTFGGTIVRAGQVMRGKVSQIHHSVDGLFRGVENPFAATRYHSLVAQADDSPDCVQATAWTDDAISMKVKQRENADLPVS